MSFCSRKKYARGFSKLQISFTSHSFEPSFLKFNFFFFFPTEKLLKFFFS